MIAHNLGYPRIGSHRELKKSCELYWSGKIDHKQLHQTAQQIRQQNWLTQKNAGIELIPCNDFSFYDHVLDMSLTVNAIPERFHSLASSSSHVETDIYFAMARGYQKEGLDITAMEMTKWFDTNYHYIVPEFVADQKFSLFSNHAIHSFVEAKELLKPQIPKPVLLGPVSYLLLGKEKEAGFHRLDLLDRLLPVYEELLSKLCAYGAQWIQLDEPMLVMDLSDRERKAYLDAYSFLRRSFPQLKFLVTTYFECAGTNLNTLMNLPVDAIHVDLVRCPGQLDDILHSDFIKKKTILSLGVVDGRNIWINNLEQSLSKISKAKEKLGDDRLMLAPSCSLLHVPCDLDLETDKNSLLPEIKLWMAFAKQKLGEVVTLKQLAQRPSVDSLAMLANNREVISIRKESNLSQSPSVKIRVASLGESDEVRKSPFSIRQLVQEKSLGLPLFPTTTIGSFPQTKEVRLNRSRYKKGEKSQEEYEQFIREETEAAIRWQDEIGLDVLVHGEYERNDMVEYFGELLEGIAFSENGWVQSYGSRCVKPPIIYGDVQRKEPMTVKWSTFAQSLTASPVKGMLTGPVTILQWSFVRDDQPRRDTCLQIALAIRDEVIDLEKAGIKIIQIDEPAVREGLPLRQENWKEYLDWAVRAFKISASGVKDETQIHTHMCYAEFNDIIESIAAMDADVITIETSRSQMELLEAFAQYKYPNEIGPGVYDIHSPRIPSREEMMRLINKAMMVVKPRQLWINPDCGLKTRHWEETRKALVEMVQAARELREVISQPA